MLLYKKDNKITWVQPYVALSFVINLLKSLFWNDFSSNFNFLNFTLWFSDSRAFEERFFFKFCFCCCYFVSIVFNLFFFCFLFIEFNFSFQWQLLNNFTIFLELSELNECFCFFLELNCLRASIVKRSVILMKHFFKNMF